MSIKDKAKDLVKELKKEAGVIKGERTKDKEYTSTRRFADEEAARRAFPACRDRLFRVDGWSNIEGLANADFKLFDGQGQPVQRPQVQTGDFIRIDLPGPLPMYWVKALELKNEQDLAEFTVKPSEDPTGEQDPTTTAHFFHEEARSLFRVERRGREIVASEIGTEEAVNTGRKAGNKGALNTLVSETGWLFFQEHQWKNLTDYLVGKKAAESEKPPTANENTGTAPATNDHELVQPEKIHFEDDGSIPNSRFPTLIYRNVFSADEKEGAGWLEERFAANRWTNAWRNGVFDYHHYHSTSHEVLGVYAGSALLQLGGERGQRVNVEAGDIIVIPAGVGHKCLEDHGLKVVGAYPDGRSYDLLTGASGERPQADENIARVPLPSRDPLHGQKGGLMEFWN